ncbi:LLM class flavin-dependent oxidoreductase [Afifella pfennigii]|uniref:LLM class flavin-dependent oxidoreductase n=1 Tax=Afifella pfennigii TaxID=209897 RepID=UPI00054E863F|nr:LLM class flavin-dependent oxidoreductase [Afifella pfennigii]
MKFSFSLVPTLPLREFGKIIRRAEAWGFDLVWIPDQGFVRDPFVSLAHVASATERIGFGIGVTNPFSRHPMQVARAMGALADLRNGQIVLGIGAGEKSMRDALGAPAGGFVESAREMIRAIRALFAGERLDVEAPSFVLRDAAMEFKPINHVPIFIASTHPDAFRLAGEMADGVIIGDVAEPDALRVAIGAMREGAEAAGRDPAEVQVVDWVATVCVESTEEAAHVRGLLREHVMRPTIGTMHKVTRESLGIEPDRGKAVRDAFRNSEPISAELVPDELVDRLTLIGDAETLARRIQEFEAAGVTMMGMRMPYAIARTYDFEVNLQRLAERVLPLVRN